MLQKLKKPIIASASLLMLAACTANGSISPIPNDPNDPEPIATPTAVPTTSPTAEPTPTPTATPGWSNVVIQAKINSFADVLAEVRRLETTGEVTGATVLGNYQIQLNASASIIARLTEMSQAEVIPFNTVIQREFNVDNRYTTVLGNFDEFVGFWRQNISQLDAVPGVDFNTHSVIAVYAGRQARLGYTTQINTITRSNNQLKVRYSVVPPTSNTATAMFNPAHVVSIPLSRQNGAYTDVVFEQE